MPSYQPPVGFHFRVEFDLPGIADNDFRFREVAGLSMEVEEETLNEGGENRFSHKFPVRARYPDLVLKRGLLKGSAVFNWCKNAIQDLDIAPTTVWVMLLDGEHKPLQTYTVVNAWPKKWSISDFNAETSAIVVESMDLAYHYYRVE
jgi:phage tail-like protein